MYHRAVSVANGQKQKQVVSDYSGCIDSSDWY